MKPEVELLNGCQLTIVHIPAVNLRCAQREFQVFYLNSSAECVFTQTLK